VTRWYLAFAAFAAALASFSGQPIERCLGTCAAIGYAAFCSYSSERSVATPSPSPVASSVAGAVPTTD
jgi:hypothetical protein